MNRFVKIKLFHISILLSLYLFACCGEKDDFFTTDHPQLVPMLNQVQIDGNAGDWPSDYPYIRLFSDITGIVPDSSDMFARFRLAWDDKGLLLLSEVIDDVIFEDKKKFWNGDGMEIFISPSRGSFDIVQVSIRPSFDLKDTLTEVICYDHRRSDSLVNIPPQYEFCSKKVSGGYRIEGRIYFEMIGIDNPAPETELAVQIYMNDADIKEDSTNHSLPWYPARESYRNPYSFHKVILHESALPATMPEIRAYIEDDQLLYIKVIYDKSLKDNKLEILGADINKQFYLHREKPNLYSNEWKLSETKVSRKGKSLLFFQNDSLFFSINHCLIYRAYENKSRPNRFEDEIRIFEIVDHFKPPPVNAFLFTGSSTIRQWHSIKKDLPGMEVINRGFGGSTMEDLNFYRDRIVFPYNPSRIYVYEGDNDIARGASPQEFINECVEFINACKKNIPETEIYFISIKLSPSRKSNWKDMQEANNMLAKLPSQFKGVHFIDISPYFYEENGTLKKNIFKSGRLHLNRQGYEILIQAIQATTHE